MAGFVGGNGLRLLREVVDGLRKPDLYLHACPAHVPHRERVSCITQRQQECLVEQPLDGCRAVAQRRGGDVVAALLRVEFWIVGLLSEDVVDQLEPGLPPT